MSVFSITGDEILHKRSQLVKKRIFSSGRKFFPFNPIALRKTKIAYNFGLSECSRVKIYPNLER